MATRLASDMRAKGALGSAKNEVGGVGEQLFFESFDFGAVFPNVFRGSSFCNFAGSREYSGINIFTPDLSFPHLASGEDNLENL